MKKWTKKEEEQLIDLYNKLNNKELIKKFDRSYISIYKKARRLGLYKTKEMEFNNRSLARRYEKGANWKGGRKKNKAGYILVLDHEHPSSHVSGYILEHVMIAEKMIGRRLKHNEIVHHKNGVKTDNRPENLEVMDRGQHTILHHLGNKRSIETTKKISASKTIKFDEETMLKLYQKGMLQKDIAKDLGVSAMTISRRLKEYKERGII